MTSGCHHPEELLDTFIENNKKDGIRVFVAGGSRSGNDPIYEEEAYNLGLKLVKMNFKLDFGLSNKGIMGAVARGVLDRWEKDQCGDNTLPIEAVTTKEYYKLYSRDEDCFKLMNVVVAKTLEERKRKLLNADLVVFAPGGVGTLDELAYDCVAMQDGLLSVKPFFIYNINGYFHHLLEFLKSISAKGFSDNVPFIVVDNSDEIEIAFRLLKLCYDKCENTKQAYANSRQLAYELPYFIKRKQYEKIHIEEILAEIEKIRSSGTPEEKQALTNDIETAYLEKEIQRMYERLAKTGQDTAVVSEKLSRLKLRHKNTLKPL